MSKLLKEDRRLIRVTEICLALPEEARTSIGDHFSFGVRNKKFAYYLDNHHGDGIVAVCFRTIAGENEVLFASERSAILQPCLHRAKRVVGLRLGHGGINMGGSRRFPHRQLSSRSTQTSGRPGHCTAAKKGISPISDYWTYPLF